MEATVSLIVRISGLASIADADRLQRQPVVGPFVGDDVGQKRQIAGLDDHRG
jgi:hypothetical protein